ncbi:MAG: hypothetical protein RI554_11710, partial [Trueperaceae bacterium]|nr:hypothetical protein [Trueperaceae bacterium]
STLGESDRFAELDNNEQRYLYLMLIPHADAEGRLKGNPQWINGKVLTYVPMDPTTIEQALRRMHEVGLVVWYEVDGKRFIQIERFHDHNKVRKDREGQSVIPSPPEDSRSTPGVRQEDAGKTPAEVEVEVEVEVQVEDQVQEKTTSPNGDTLEPLLEAWNENRGQLPAAQKLTSTRKQKLRTLQRDLGGFDPTYAAIAIAAKEVSQDPFWVQRGYGLDNLLAGQKVIQKAETAFNRGSFDHDKAETDRILNAIGGP